jgi:cytoplasmic iron level regulating protein YaaA (DUF328/UPF0246 family)
MIIYHGVYCARVSALGSYFLVDIIVSMKIIFSPSKAQKTVQKSSMNMWNIPFTEKTQFIIDAILKLSLENIKNTFKLSPEKSKELLENYTILDTKSAIPAIDAFSGTSFRELEIEGYSELSYNYCHEHLVILSALYGPLKPNDLIYPYRLDMNNNIFKDTHYKNLYYFWSREITEYFNEEDIMINLASKEYSKLLENIDQDKIITIHFLVQNEGVLKSISVFAKQQRGKLLNYMIQKRIKDYTLIKNYESDGYLFDQTKSDKNNYYFVKVV